jgi:glutathione S-transferase
MILIGMFDSPFVRRVAVSLTLLDLPFEHRDWSVGRDFEAIRRFNPLGRVPTLVLDDGEALMESAAILDYLDDLVGPARAMVPPTGLARRQAHQLMAMASGAAEKGVLLVYERVFRPEEKRHAPWVERCRSQVDAALAELERRAALRPGQWLVGERITQADITVACVLGFLKGALGVAPGPALAALAGRCEALPAFERITGVFSAPAAPTAPG